VESSRKTVAKPLTVACEDCGRKYAVQPTHIGKRVKCKNCGHVFVAAEPMASLARKTVNIARTPSAGGHKSPPPIPRSAPKPKAIAMPTPVVSEEPKPDAVVEKSKKPAIILSAVFAVALAIVGALLGNKYYGSHHRTEPVDLPRIAPGMQAPFSSSGFHDYAGEQTLERTTANNLETLTGEVLIYRDRHNGQLPKSLDDLDLHYGGNDPRISPFDKSLGKHGYAYMPINLGPDIDRVLLYDIGELQKRGITHLVMSKYHQVRTMDREQLAKQPNVSL
jgi:predicted Zn finger-like uncharacterized protein